MIVKQFEIKPEKYRIIKEADSCFGLLLVLQRYIGKFWFFGWHDYWRDILHLDFDKEGTLENLIKKADEDFNKIQEKKKRYLKFEELPDEIDSFTLPRDKEIK